VTALPHCAASSPHSAAWTWRSGGPLTKLSVRSRLEAVSFAVRYRLPDLWPKASMPAAAAGWPGRGRLES
jgi:hypothetical protein